MSQKLLAKSQTCDRIWKSSNTFMPLGSRLGNISMWAPPPSCPSACSWSEPPTGVMSAQVHGEWEPRTPVTMRPLCSSGCQPVCPRVLFPSNLHLPFRPTAFLSPFPPLSPPTPPTNFLWGDYLGAEPETYWFRWRDTHNPTVNFFDGTRHSPPRSPLCAGNNASGIVFNKLTTNCMFSCVPAGRWNRNP